MRELEELQNNLRGLSILEQERERKEREQEHEYSGHLLAVEADLEALRATIANSSIILQQERREREQEQKEVSRLKEQLAAARLRVTTATRKGPRRATMTTQVPTVAPSV